MREWELIVLRRSSHETLRGDRDTMKAMYIQLENEVDVVGPDERVVAIFLYGDNGDLIDAYTTKGTL